MHLLLNIELVPKTAWYKNVRSELSASEWNNIRNSIYKKYNNKCAICGNYGKLHCHEVWEYNAEKHIQKLVGFIALCEMCHHVKHIGFASILEKQGKLNYELVIEHFMKVNNCNRLVFEEHKREAFKQWEERSNYSWNIDLENLKSCNFI